MGVHKLELEADRLRFVLRLSGPVETEQDRKMQDWFIRVATSTAHDRAVESNRLVQEAMRGKNTG